MNQETQVFSQLHTDYFPYYRSWCHDMPIVISQERDDELRRVQELLYRSVCFYAEHYPDRVEAPADTEEGPAETE